MFFLKITYKTLGTVYYHLGNIYIIYVYMEKNTFLYIKNEI